MPKQHFHDFCEDRARQGDGAFAVAYALLDLAKAQGSTASALRQLGLGDAATSMGALEALMVQMKETGERIADAIEGDD